MTSDTTISQSEMAQKVGFRSSSLTTILAIAACDRQAGIEWGQAQYNIAWLQTRGGKDFSMFPSANGTMPDYIKHLSILEQWKAIIQQWKGK